MYCGLKANKGPETHTEPKFLLAESIFSRMSGTPFVWRRPLPSTAAVWPLLGHLNNRIAHKNQETFQSGYQRVKRMIIYRKIVPCSSPPPGRWFKYVIVVLCESSNGSKGTSKSCFGGNIYILARKWSVWASQIPRIHYPGSEKSFRKKRLVEVRLWYPPGQFFLLGAQSLQEGWRSGTRCVKRWGKAVGGKWGVSPSIFQIWTIHSFFSRDKCFALNKDSCYP